jgi:glycosyltransferase involved in cell wall biosynthesis
VSDVVMPLKRALRPLIPNRVMARYRLHQHSKAVRVNVDVAVAAAGDARRWLATTPDTYRVIDVAVLGDVPDDVVTIPEGAAALPAARLLSRTDIAAAVMGELAPPRLRDAGHRIGLVPVLPAGAEARRTDPIAAGPVVILAAVPMHDVGGGSRGAQLALELIRRGYHVTHVHLFPSYEEVDLGLRFIHPRLEQVRFDGFDTANLVERATAAGGVVILEVPAPEYAGPVSRLGEAGWETVYDIIDDWSDPALGGGWYDPSLERHFIGTADVVAASAPDLVGRAAEHGRDAVLVPNAVNATVFAGEETARPADLPEGRLIGYHGSLYGDWFDWDALAAVAWRDPQATVVLIGEARRVPESLPENVVFLGIRAQQDLPAYLSRFDVGIVPFAVTATTHAVSPLKVYEYLACGVPVAAPPLRALQGLDGVHTDPDLTKAVAAALGAPKPDPAQALLHHSWGNRLGDLFSSLGHNLVEASATPVRIEHRPARHYARGERRIPG